MTDVDDVAELARFIREYGSAPKLLAEHAPDGSGRCPRCHGGGTGSAGVRGGCTLWRAALAARR